MVGSIYPGFERLQGPGAPAEAWSSDIERAASGRTRPRAECKVSSHDGHAEGCLPSAGRILRSSPCRIWVAYLFVLSALLNLATHLARIPQYVTVFKDSQGFRGTRVHFVLAVVALVLYPLHAAILAILGQVQMGFVASACRGSPFLRLKVCVLALMCRDRTDMETIDTVLLGTMSFAVLAGAAVGSHGMLGGDILGDALSSALLFSTALGYLHVALELALNFYPDSLARYEALMAEERPHAGASKPPSVEDPLPGMVLGCKIVGAACATLLLLGCLPVLTHGYLTALMSGIFPVVAFGVYKICRRLVAKLFFTDICPAWYWVAIGSYVIMLNMVYWGPRVLGRDGRNLIQRGTLAPLASPTPYDLSYQSKSELAERGLYPVCRIRWGGLGTSLESQLGVLDLCAFAEAAYSTSCAGVLRVVQNATKHTDLGNVSMLECEADTEYARVAMFRVPGARAVVMSVRGSLIARDWLFDMDIWMPAALYGVVQWLMPLGAAVMPASFARRYVSLPLLDLLGLAPKNARVAMYARRLKRHAQREGFAAIVTGHSLGGAIAHLVGAEAGLPSVSFSALGTRLSMGRMDLERASMIASTATSIVPWGDVVPLLDGQDGTVQHISCTARNFLHCHKVERTTCELFRKCGDPRGRSASERCSEIVGPNWDEVPWTGFLWES